MRISIVSVCLFLLAESFAIGRDQGSIDYSRCGVSMAGQRIPYQMDQTGKMYRPKHDADLISYSNRNGIEKAVVKAPSNFGKSHWIYTFILNTKDGRSVSSEMLMDYKNPDGKKVRFGSKGNFAYDGEKCYVSEIIEQFPDPETKKWKAVAVYNKEMCDKVLAAEKSIGEEKIQECGRHFRVINGIRGAYQRDYESRGVKLGFAYNVDFTRLIDEYARDPTNVLSSITNVDAVNLISGCKAYRAAFPTNDIQSTGIEPPPNTFGFSRTESAQ